MTMSSNLRVTSRTILPGTRVSLMVHVAVSGAVIAVVSAILVSCAAKTDKAAALTLTDFRAQNIERVHDGTMVLVGEDSAGKAAKEYIRLFEEGLLTKIPTQSAMPAPETEIPADNNELASLYAGYQERQRRLEQYRAMNDVPTDPEILELKRYLDGRKGEAMGELRRRNEAFNSARDNVSAKMGLAAGYVAVSCANEPNDVETITRLVEPLLAALTAR